MAAALRRPQRRVLLALRLVMLLIAGGGLLGAYEHVAGNLEIAVETHAGAAWTSLLPQILQGASPLLAPGILGLAAVLAIAATYEHPALQDAKAM